MTESPGGATLRLGTRRSALARTQSDWVADLLRGLGHQVQLVDVVTEGDISRAPLTTIGGTGVFVSALREALREGEIDLAVHSLKDLPTQADPDLVVAAIPTRQDPRDVVIGPPGTALADLPAGAAVGTGSPRRAAQLAIHRPDLRIRSLRGNVDTRIRMVRDGTLDAVILAAAGLHRLSRFAEASYPLEPEVMLPAPGQGALAVECSVHRPEMIAELSRIDHQPTRVATIAERAMLAALEAGCTAPVGALAVVDGGADISLTGFVGTQDGASYVRRTLDGPVSRPQELGRGLAEQMLAAGARRFGAE